MGQLTDASGRPVNSRSAAVDTLQLTQLEDSLQPKDIGRLDFQIFGSRMIVEAIAPDTVTEQGIVLPQGEDQPYYRIVRFGSKEYTSQINKVANLGDLVYTRQVALIGIYHQFPRHERNGITHDRTLLMLDYANIDAIIPGHAWEDPTPAERIIGDMQIADFSEDFINTITTDMLTPEEAGQIDFVPLGDKIIVERVPSESRKGSILIPDMGKAKAPIFRLLKKPSDTSVLPPHLQGMEVGDLMLIMNVDPMRDDFPTKLRKPNGERRDILLTHAGFALGWWPTLSFRNIQGSVTKLSDSTKSEEAVG